MGGNVVERLVVAAFGLGRNSQAWTARLANGSSHSGLEIASTDGDVSRGYYTRTNVSSTGEWCLADMFPARARRVEHTAEPSGTDAI